ncbi:FAD binding domain-containing protein [Photobacterium sagamiensis]|uniref:FAD binding domain-containing protein n=1 Tax=Photobacterium sagamiensis TaxID=2910241 RepID=UPI003D0D2A23
MSSRLLPEFELKTPQSVDETLELLATNGESAVIISGGSDLLVAMKFSRSPATVISIAELPDLDYIKFDPELGLHIGARVTLAQVLRSEVIKEHYPPLWQAAETFATPQIRNSATVIGNVLRGSPAGDCSCAILALGGQLVLKNNKSSREVPIDDFWTGYNQTALKRDELAMEIKLPAPGACTRSVFKRMTRVNEDLAKLNAAVRLEMNGKVCHSARLAIGCVGPTTMRLPKTEALLAGSEINATTLAAIADTVATEISPIDDKRSTRDYRMHMSGVLVKRLVIQAAGLTA